jgi:hypothetical protein
MITVKLRVKGRTPFDYSAFAWVIVEGETLEECEEAAKRAFSIGHEIDYYSISVTFAFLLKDDEPKTTVLKLSEIDASFFDESIKSLEKSIREETDCHE